MPNKIGINFKDNDFGTVAMAFMEGLRQYDINKYTKEKVVKVWNDSCGGLYRLYQNPYEYNLDQDTSFISSYLKITEKDVYFDEEVDIFLNKNSLNGEFVVVSITPKSRKNEGYCYIA